MAELMTVPISGPAARPEALGTKLNWLRAGVLGANDGIVSIAGIVVGVAGATSNSLTILIAGLAGLVAGALSMAGGEYVSVSTQRDTELSALTRVRAALRDNPAEERVALAQAYEAKGLSSDIALRVADELSEKDAVAAHAEVELGIDSAEPVSPWAAALASAVAFVAGAIVPLLTMVLAPAQERVVATVAAVTLTLAATGAISAFLGGSSWTRPIVRNVLVGNLAMALTYGTGSLIGITL